MECGCGGTNIWSGDAGRVGSSGILAARRVGANKLEIFPIGTDRKNL